MKDKDIISVSLYLDKLNGALKQERARIVGEVSGVQMYEGVRICISILKIQKISRL